MEQKKRATKGYTGAFRRRQRRRLKADRRVTDREDPDRRQESGRREEDKIWAARRAKLKP